MEELSKPVPNNDAPSLGERGHHSLSFLNPSDHFSISLPGGFWAPSSSFPPPIVAILCLRS